MNEAMPIFQNLKRILKSRGLTYKDLGQEIGLSEPSIKRIFGQSNMDIARLVKICQRLDINLSDLTQTASANLPVRLTPSQEAALVRDEKLFIYFVLITRKWSAKQILAEYRYNQSESTRYLLALQKLQLLELFPNDRVKLKVAVKIEWIPGGPVMQMYERIVTKDFFEHRFGSAGERLTLLNWEVTQATMELLSRRIERFVKDLDSIASTDQSLEKKHTRSVAFLAGFRNWTLPVFENYKR